MTKVSFEEILEDRVYVMTKEELKYKSFLESLYKSSEDFKVRLVKRTKDDLPVCHYRDFSNTIYMYYTTGKPEDMVYDDSLPQTIWDVILHEYSHHLCDKFTKLASAHNDTQLAIELILDSMAKKTYPELKVIRNTKPIKQLSCLSERSLKRAFSVFKGKADDIYNEVLYERRKRKA